VAPQIQFSLVTFPETVGTLATYHLKSVACASVAEELLWLVPNVARLELTQKPRWTNTIPAKYVERRLLCQNCGLQRRLVPIDAKSHSDSGMNEFHDSVRGFSQKVQLERLQEQRSSSRHHRWQKSAAKTTSKKKAGMPRMLKLEHVESRQDKGPVQTKCTLCHEKGPLNYHPQWLVGSDVYLARRTVKCISATCIGACRHWIPMDEGIEYMTQATFDTDMKKGTFGVKTCARPRIKHRQNLKTT
jgi:hypothetical protein